MADDLVNRELKTIINFVCIKNFTKGRNNLSSGKEDENIFSDEYVFFHFYKNAIA